MGNVSRLNVGRPAIEFEPVDSIKLGTSGQRLAMARHCAYTAFDQTVDFLDRKMRTGDQTEQINLGELPATRFRGRRFIHLYTRSAASPEPRLSFATRPWPQSAATVYDIEHGEPPAWLNIPTAAMPMIVEREYTAQPHHPNANMQDQRLVSSLEVLRIVGVLQSLDCFE